MKVILKKTIRNLGKIGSVVSVKDGYARNYLIPKDLVLVANKQNLDDIESKMKELSVLEMKNHSLAESVKNLLQNQMILFVLPASDDGVLYGSIKQKDISCKLNSIIKESSIQYMIDSNCISLKNAIKSISVSKISVILDSDVTFDIFINISRTESEADTNFQNWLKSLENNSKDEQRI